MTEGEKQLAARGIAFYGIIASGVLAVCGVYVHGCNLALITLYGSIFIFWVWG